MHDVWEGRVGEVFAPDPLLYIKYWQRMAVRACAHAVAHDEVFMTGCQPEPIAVCFRLIYHSRGLTTGK